MLIVHFGLTVFVTVKAGEGFEVCRVIVARRAGGPLASMFSRVDREIQGIMVEGAVVEGKGGMAIQAGRGETGLRMFFFEIGQVATQAIVLADRVPDRLRGSTYVTACARQGFMCPNEAKATRCRHVVEGGPFEGECGMAV